MKTVKKVIKRKTAAAARAAMINHILLMNSKGWQVADEFEGEAGLSFEVITYFWKE